MANGTDANFMIHRNRSKQACQDLIQDWGGISVSDNYGAYTKWIDLRQTCLAHLIRKTKSLSERKDPSSSEFSQLITKDLQLLCHWAKESPADRK